MTEINGEKKKNNNNNKNNHRNVYIQYKIFKRDDQNTPKENRKEIDLIREMPNTGKNFIFYLFLARSRNNSLQHYYG